MNDTRQRAERRMIEIGLKQTLGGEEPRKTPEEILTSLDEKEMPRILRPWRGVLELAAACLLVAFAIWGIPYLRGGPASVAPEGEPENAAGDEEIRKWIGQLDSADPAAAKTALLGLLGEGERAREALAAAGAELSSAARTRFHRAYGFAQVLGTSGGLAFAEADGGIARLEAYLEERSGLMAVKFGPDTYLMLGDAVLEGFPWLTQYDDKRHQKDLFRLRELIVENDLGIFSGVFARMVENPAPYVRLHGVMGLELLKSRQFEDVVRAARDDPDSRVRIAALTALNTFGTPGYDAEIAASMKDPDPKVRQRTVETLGGYRKGGGETRHLILDALKDENYRVRMAAATRIHRESDTTAIPFLEAMLADRSRRAVNDVVRSAIEGLSSLRGSLRAFAHSSTKTSKYCKRNERAYLLLSSEEEYRLTLERAGIEVDPTVNFETYMVVMIFFGKTVNCSGVSADFLEDDERIVVRFTGNYYQSIELGGGTGGRPGRGVQPYGFFVIPRSNKTVVYYENTQGMIGYPPVWKKQAERKIKK